MIARKRLTPVAKADRPLAATLPKIARKPRKPVKKVARTVTAVAANLSSSATLIHYQVGVPIVDRYVENNRNALVRETQDGTFSGRFEHTELPLRSEPIPSSRYGTHRQIYEKRASRGEAEGRSSTALLEHDCRDDAICSAPHYEGSR